jgi:hypothetical protein
VAVQQSEGYASLADQTKSIVQSLLCIDAEIQDGFDRQHTLLTALHSRTETSMKAHAKQDKDEHNKLSSQIIELSQQSGHQSDRVIGAQIDTRMAVEMSIDQNLAEHNKTREEMNRLKEQAERQVEVLTEEIRQLKIELEASVKSIVASLGTASKKEEQKLKDISNAKFNLWVAKELILEKLKVSPSCRLLGVFDLMLGFHCHVPFQFCNGDVDQYHRPQVLEAHAIPETVRSVSYWNHVCQ